ncbi:hypothetical protein P691DRAFT_764085 [Macrolepiota fuliginosa MF-IS2]|uniref:Uncharacterized protein n=1 Tax=Macrolepiota fuliginosa MF-IS2 TaxID=1400762 RepID=A0A9P5X303_9AGAR|nr:hypothetical protein P691DRAFT_764085 [Macrolepiota fuliginosa MF-IS2]
MKSTQFFFALVALFATAVIASPAPSPATETTCQFGSIFGAGDALCSAHCIAEGDIHGGHCDSSLHLQLRDVPKGDQFWV